MAELVVLPPETKEQIDAALQLAKALKEEIRRANVAGIPLDFTIEDVEKEEARLRAIKQAYFPTGRSK